MYLTETQTQTAARQKACVADARGDARAHRFDEIICDFTPQLLHPLQHFFCDDLSPFAFPLVNLRVLWVRSDAIFWVHHGQHILRKVDVRLGSLAGFLGGDTSLVELFNLFP
jgi:hypothetical protein